MKWENVYIFISSTFNDMHAERDYLIKRVFPRLSEWCEEHRLRLYDIDLRWGVSEADTENNRVLQTCLNRIDECRPFFLCFVGQRRGWVPSEDYVDSKTRKQFPNLEDNSYLGKNSITELEIIHAKIDPMHNGEFFDNKGNLKDGSAVEYAFFYLKDPNYLNDLPDDLKIVYTNDNDVVADEELNKWREVEIPKTNSPVISYNASWCCDESTPEISLPLIVPTTAVRDSEPWKNAFETWKSRWSQENVKVDNTGEITDPKELLKAKKYNENFTKGRLCDFNVNDEELADIIFTQLKEAIIERFGDRIVEKLSPLQKEIDQQEQFLRIASEGFIEQKQDIDPLNDYISNDKRCPLAITAAPGMGKTSLLAHWIEKYQTRENESLHYRFIGVSDDTVNQERLIRSILLELKEEGKIKGSIPLDFIQMINKLPDLLEELGNSGKTILIIDALDQLESGMKELYWIPSQLPKNVKLIISFKCEDEESVSFYNNHRLAKDMVFHNIKPFDNINERKKLVSTYLNQYFKELDEPRIESLVSSKGAENPLFLKAVLSELKVFGVHNDLTEVIKNRFGNTSVSAFHAILERMENDPIYTKLEPKKTIPHILGWIAHSRYGLTIEELVDLILREKLSDDELESRDAVNLVLRQLRLFLANRDNKVDFFYDSFRIAVLERYTKLSDYSKSSKDWHKSLANYFKDLPLENNHKLIEQAYQYGKAGMVEEYETYLFDYLYIERCLETLGSNALIEDCSYYSNKHIKLLESFHRISQESLTKHPFQLAGELWGRMEDSNDEKFDELLQQAIDVKKERNEVWLRPKFVCFDRPNNNIIRTYQSVYNLGNQVALSSDNKYMITQLGDKQLAIWNVESGKISRKISFVDEYPSRIVFSPDGKTFAVSLKGDQLGTIRVFSALTFQPLCDLQTKILWLLEGGEMGNYLVERQIAYTSDSQGIIIASGGTLIKNNRSNGTTTFRCTAGSAIKDRDGILKCPDSVIELCDVHTGEIISSVDYGYDGYSFGVGNSLIAVGLLHPDRHSNYWNEEWFEAELAPILIFEYNSKDKSLIKKTKFLEGHDNSVKVIAVSIDDKMVASSDINGNVKLWDLKTFKLLSEVSKDKMGVSFLKFLDNGKKLAVGGSDNVIRIYSTPNLTLINSIFPKMNFSSGCFFSDETHCVLISGNILKLISLKHSNGKNFCSDELVSIGKDHDRNLIVASSYHNYIEPHKEPLLFIEPKGHIHFFDGNNNNYLFSKSLSSVKNRDLVFVDIDGKSIVSKDVSYNETDAIFKYWSLKYIAEGDKIIFGDFFIINDFHHSMFWDLDSRYAKFSLNNEYLITLNNGFSIYASQNGRLLNEINSNLSFFSSLFYNLFHNMKKSELCCYSPDFGISSSGDKFCCLEDNILCYYNINSRKYRKIRFKDRFIEDSKLIISDDEILLVDSGFDIKIIDIPREKVIFKLDRTKRENGENCFSSINKECSLLVLSRNLYGEGLVSDDLNENDNFSKIENIAIWDIKNNCLISEFFIEGHATNIIIEGLEFTFGLSNGEICTLFLENL